MLHLFRTPAALSVAMFQGWSVFNIDLSHVMMNSRSHDLGPVAFFLLLVLGMHAALQILTLLIAPRETVKALTMPACLVGLLFLGLPVGMAVGTLILPIIAVSAALSGDPGFFFVGVILIAYVLLTAFVFLAAEEKSNGRSVRGALWIIGIR